MENAGGKRKFKTAGIFIILMLCECFFFRNILGNDLLIGSRGDGRLTNMLTEHWWRFFQGKEQFSELLMFYPVKGVVGYTDMLLGHGILYSIFRLLGCNMFVSYKFALLLMHSMGTTAMAYLLYRKLNLGMIWSIFGTIAFCFSDTLTRHIVHTQLIAVSMLPVLLIFIIGFIRCFEVRKKRNIYACVCIFWFALLTYTAWYVAFFTGMFGLIYLLTCYIGAKLSNGDFLSAAKRLISVVKYDWIGYLVLLVVLYIPFVYVYLPVLQESSGYSYDTVSSYLPELIDLINVTESNLMLGSFMRLLKLGDRGYSGEVTEGFSCILLVLFFYMFLILRKINHKQNKNDNVWLKWEMFVTKNVFVTVLICICCIIRLGSNGVSLWKIVYLCIPGAKSIRVVARFLLWLSFPIAVITAYCSDRYVNKGCKKTIAGIILTTLLFLFNINTIGIPSDWSLNKELAFLENVESPPESADCFYLIDSEKNEDPVIDQVDAFAIGSYYGVKTINGYSGQFPSGWDGLWDICSSDYESNMFEWIITHGLKDVYAYDRTMNIWTAFEKRMEICLDECFYPMENKFSISKGLEDFKQGEFVWIGQEFQTVIKNPAIQRDGLVIKLQPSLSYYKMQNPDLDPYIQLYVDGEYIQDIPVTDEYEECRVRMEDHKSDYYKVALKTNCFFCPKTIGINGDARNLSIALHYIGNE